MKMAQEDSECTWEAGVEGSLGQAVGCASQPWEHGTAASSLQKEMGKEMDTAPARELLV